MTGAYGDFMRSHMPQAFLAKVSKKPKSLHLILEPKNNEVTLCKAFLHGEEPYYVCLSLQMSSFFNLLGVSNLKNPTLKILSADKEEHHALAIPGTPYKILFEKPPIDFFTFKGFLYSVFVGVLGVVFMIYFWIFHARLFNAVQQNFQNQLAPLQNKLEERNSENRQLSKGLGKVEHTLKVTQESAQEKEKLFKELLQSHIKRAQGAEEQIQTCFRTLLLENQELLSSEKFKKMAKSIREELSILAYRMFPHTSLDLEKFCISDIIQRLETLFSKKCLKTISAASLIIRKWAQKY